MKTFLAVIAFFLFSISFFAQKNISPSWTAEFSKSKSFIENKGQFDKHENFQTGKIHYAIDYGSTKIFFGEKGVSYNFLEINKKSREERAAIMQQPATSFEDHKQKEKLFGKFMVKSDQVNMSWSNPNEKIEINGVRQSPDYHSYTFKNKNNEEQNVNYVKGFDHIIYKNIYPNIDIKYELHPVIGVKYAYLVHPGADVSRIKMIFDRDITLRNGEIFIPTLFGDIIDHAPITFYEEKKDQIINSNYTLLKNQISFELGQFDNSKTIVIDPWVQTPVFPLNWDCVWELDTDAAGNVYIIGGVDPLQLKKYNNAGVLQWSYDTPYDTTSWLGTMATDDAGNSYVTNGTDYKILKVNTAGGLVWSNNAPSGGQLSTEFWNISFNCDQTKLIVGGTGGNFEIHGKIYEVNMANGDITAAIQVTQAGNAFSIPPQIQEVRGMSAAPNGKYYFVTLDTIGYMNDDLTLCPGTSSSLFMKNHGVNWGYKSENWRYNNTGIKVIRADANFVYLNKGNALQKRSLADFSLIASVAIPGGVLSTPFLSDNVTENAGIDIDDCGNIYVGSKTGVYKFNSSLVQQAFYATSFVVYDVRVSTAGDVIACGGTGDSGSGTRSGGVQSFAASACVPIAITCCDATICIPQSLCQNDSPITLTPATAGGTWSGNGVSALGVFNPTTAGLGNHLITYTLACGSETITITVSTCTSLTVCEETNGDLTVSGGVGPYTWAEYIPASSTPITNSTECASCGYTWFFGSCLNGATPVTDCNTPAYWSNFGTGTTVTPPAGATQIQITDGTANTFTFDPATVLACVTNPCPLITVTTTSQTNVLCFGNNTGAATVSASGGVTAYTYTWMPGNLNGASQTNLAAGTYTVNVVDGNACPGSTTVTITQPASAVSATANSTPTNCGSNTGSATATPTGGTGSYSYAWSPSGGSAITASNLAAGTYTVTVTDGNSCQTTANTVVTTNGGPTISVVSSQDVSCNGANDGSATVSGSGGSGTLSYSWSPSGLTGASQAVLEANTYTVTVTDGGGCSNTTTVTIAEPSAILLSSSNIVSANCGVNDGAATVDASGGAGSYSYLWSPTGGTAATASNISGGSYNVDVEDLNGCSESITIIVPSIGGPTVTLQSSSDVSCFGGNDGEAIITANGGTAPYTYSWTPTGGNTATASNLNAGTYTCAVTDDIGCVGVISVSINQANEILISETITDMSCGATDGEINTISSGGAGSYTYLWTPNGEITSSISNLVSGSYTLTVEDINGCTTSETYTVATIGTIPVNLTPLSTSIQQGETVQLNASGATSYSWTPSNGLSCADCPDPIANPSITTTYTVTGTDASGCTGTAELTLFVIQVCGDIYVPTVFSPNGTGPSQNNTLCVYGNCIAELNYSVYNRWGERVFETSDNTICWDGTYKGKALNSGVYAYKLVVTLFDGFYIEDSGNLTLVR